MSNLDAAIRYAELGFPVFPLFPGKKYPNGLLAPNGFNDATTDIGTITDWWTRSPGSGIGMATKGLIVIDIDLGGESFLEHDPEMRAELHLDAIQAQTPSGGRHLLFRQPDGKRYASSTSKLFKNVDVRADGGYIAVWPTELKPYAKSSGGQYTWNEEFDVPADKLKIPPQFLLDMLTETKPSESNLPMFVARKFSPDEVKEICLSPQTYASVYEPELAFESLIESGWQVHSRLADGEIRLTRPGKRVRDGHSASWNSPAGRSRQWGFPRFAVYSSSPDCVFQPIESGGQKSYSAWDVLHGLMDIERLREAEGKRWAYCQMEYPEMYEDVAWEYADGSTGAKPNSGKKKLIVKRGSSFKLKAVDWLVPHLIPIGNASMMIADAGTGKSSVVRSIIAHLVKGEGCLSYRGGPVEVLICMAEDSFETIYKPALMAEGVTREQMDMVHWVSGVGMGDEITEEFSSNNIHLVEDFLAENPGIKLILVDPLASVVANANQEMNSSEGARNSSGRLQRLADKHNVAVFILGHEVKNQEAKGINRAAGSHQHGASVRLGWRLIKSACGGIYPKWAKGNINVTRDIVWHFEQEQISEDEARQRIIEHGEIVEEFLKSRDERHPESVWEAFTRQIVTEIDAPTETAPGDREEFEEIKKAQRMERDETIRGAIVSFLENRKESGPYPINTLPETVVGMWRGEKVTMSEVRRVMNTMFEDVAPKIKRIPRVRNEPQMVALFDYVVPTPKKRGKK